MKLTPENLQLLNNFSNSDFKRHFKFLGEGIARKVYALNNDFVVKVAKNNPDGYHQNFVEEYVYYNSPARIKRYLCPIYYCTDRLIIMRKALPYNKYLNKNIYIDLKEIRDEPSVKKDIEDLISNFHLFRSDIFSSRSWGIVDNNFYLIDFGCTSNFGDSYYDTIRGIYYDRYPFN